MSLDPSTRPAPSGLDLLVVFPNNRVRAYGQLAADVAAIAPPVQAGLTAAYVRKAGYDVKILDADAENLDAAQTAKRVNELNPRLVCLSTDSINSGDVTKMAAASETLSEMRKHAPGLKVVLEGVVPSAYPEKLLRTEGADFVCQGEAYEPIVQLLKAVKDGRPETPIHGIWRRDGETVTSGERAEMAKKPDGLPFIAWDLLPVSKYRAHHWHCYDRLERRSPYASIYTNLGCPYTCTFCNVNVVAGKANFRPRSPENVVEEIDLLVKQYHVSNIRIVDNVFTIKMDLVEKLCDLIIQRDYDLNFWVYARVETVRDLGVLKKMKKAGINWIAYGIEAAADNVRDAVDKHSTQAVIDRAIELTRQADISIVGNFIFGLPEDTQATMQKSFDMCRDYLFEFANFYCAMAYPGTELHNDVVKQPHVQLPTTWSGYGQYSYDCQPLPTATLTPRDVLRFRDEAWDIYFTDPKYLALLEKRFGRPAADFTRELTKIKLKRKLLEGSYSAS